MGSSRNGPLSGSWARLKTFMSPVELHDSSNGLGTSDALSHGDHVHAHGDRGGGTLHPPARRDMIDDAANSDGFLAQHYDLRFRRLAQMAVDFGLTTITTTHMPTPAFVATSMVNKNNVHGSFVQLNSGAVLSEAVTVMTANHFHLPMTPALSMKVRTGATTNGRYWFGMFDADPSAVAYDVAASSGLAAFAFSYDDTVASGGNWQVIASDGTSQTTTDTGVAVANNTTWAFEVVMDNPTAADEVRFYINGALVTTVTANLTGGSTSLRWAATRTNLAASASNFRIGLVTLTKVG